MANITAALRASGRWDDALLWISSDNGGVGPGNNHPREWGRPLKLTAQPSGLLRLPAVRGEKATPWQGGTRVAAFLAGGWLPTELAGTSNTAPMHVADVYPTLCTIVGVNPADTVDLPFGSGAKPRPIDGVDVWPLILASASTSPRPYLPTTESSIIWQDGEALWKLITAAKPAGWYPPALGYNMTGKMAGSKTEWPCVGSNGKACAICSADKPCLFNVAESQDPGERVNLAAKQPELVAKLKRALAGYVSANYASPGMSDEELEKYECITTEVTDACPCVGGVPGSASCPLKCITSAWWGNTSGPCCRPK